MNESLFKVFDKKSQFLSYSDSKSKIICSKPGQRGDSEFEPIIHLTPENIAVKAEEE